MSEVPGELRYVDSHEWARLEEDGTVTVGITEHAQKLLGDMVFVELPENDSEIKVGEEVCVVESVKSASDVYSPLSGAIIEINEGLAAAPELINSDPYGAGWLFRLRLQDEKDFDELMSAEQYSEQIAEDS